MADTESRRQKAWGATPVGWLRELVVIGAGGGLALLSFLVFGTPKNNFAAEVIVVLAALLAAVVVPVVQFAWNYVCMPWRELRDDVSSIRTEVSTLAGRLEGIDSAKAEDAREFTAPVDVRLTLINSIRTGREAIAEGGSFFSGNLRESVASNWTEGIVQFLSRSVGADATERFLQATDLTGLESIPPRLEVLQELVNEAAD